MNLRPEGVELSLDIGNKRENALLGGACVAAAEVECINCSVLSLDSFMF